MRTRPKKPQPQPDDLMINLNVALHLLRHDITDPDLDARAYSAMGVIRGLLCKLSESPCFTLAQQQQLLLIEKTWRQAVFTPETLGNSTSLQDGPIPESED